MRNFEDHPLGQKWAEDQRREHERRDVAAGVFTGQMAAYGAQRAIEARQEQAHQYAVWFSSLSPEQREAELMRQRWARDRAAKVRLSGVALGAIGLALIVVSGGGWGATIGLFVGLVGFSRLVWGGR